MDNSLRFSKGESSQLTKPGVDGREIAKVRQLQ